MGEDNEDRYNKYYFWGSVSFYLMEYTPYEDECKDLLYRVVEQTIRDFHNLQHSTAPIDQEHFMTASGLLFDDNYRIDYGGNEMSFSDILDILDLDITPVREGILERQKAYKGKK